MDAKWVSTIKDTKTMQFCKHVLSLLTLTLNCTKIKIRKVGPKLYFEKSAACKFNL